MHIFCYLEFYDREDSKYEPLKLFLDIFDYCSLYCFVLEILLKWLDHFSNFWKNNWNIFDFVVTFIVKPFCPFHKYSCVTFCYDFFSLSCQKS